MTNEEFDQQYYPRYRRIICAIARKLAGYDAGLYDDLCQAGAIKLWQVDVTRAHTNPDSYIRQAIKRGMIDFLRSEGSRDTISLDGILREGFHQVVEDEDGDGCAALVAASRKEVRMYLSRICGDLD